MKLVAKNPLPPCERCGRVPHGSLFRHQHTVACFCETKRREAEERGMVVATNAEHLMIEAAGEHVIQSFRKTYAPPHAVAIARAWELKWAERYALIQKCASDTDARRQVETICAMVKENSLKIAAALRALLP
jgi:hypothetical protein